MSGIDPAKKQSKTVVYEVTDSMSSPQASHEGEWVSSSSEEGSLDKVRDILFGAQSREFEKRFTLLESRLLEESRELRNELTQSFSDLKAQMDQAVEGLIGKLESEQSQRTTKNAEMGQLVKSLEGQLSQRVNELTQHASNQFQALGSDMQHQKAELVEQHRQAMSRIEAQHQQAVNALKEEKTDRAALAEMLMEIALRLKVGPKNAESS